MSQHVTDDRMFVLLELNGRQHLTAEQFLALQVLGCIALNNKEASFVRRFSKIAKISTIESLAHLVRLGMACLDS